MSLLHFPTTQYCDEYMYSICVYIFASVDASKKIAEC